VSSMNCRGSLVSGSRFSVEGIKSYQTQGVREEDSDYIISLGAADSLQEALKVSTEQLATWIKHDYGHSATARSPCRREP